MKYTNEKQRNYAYCSDNNNYCIVDFGWGFTQCFNTVIMELLQMHNFQI